jgi:predicted nucleic acid-binding protein
MYDIIIADTSCLIGLQNINQFVLLNKLFKSVTITPEVFTEFDSKLPNWIKIEKAKSSHMKTVLNMELDLGEASSIALALEKENSLLLIDEKKGRKIAGSLGVSILGTLGILVKAKQMGVISSLKNELNKLIKSGFYISEELIISMLKLVNEELDT